MRPSLLDIDARQGGIQHFETRNEPLHHPIEAHDKKVQNKSWLFNLTTANG